VVYLLPHRQVYDIQYSILNPRGNQTYLQEHDIQESQPNDFLDRSMG
jgi:hypothetical protein